MDPPFPKKTPQDSEENEPRSPTSRFVSAFVYTPVQLFLAVLSRGLVVLRPFTPQIIPLAICVLLVPLVLFFSASAGWIVWKSVAVTWESPLYLQYGDGIPPYASVSLPTLVPKQRYDISLRLVIPATDSNFALGNFMTSLTLSTHANKTLTSTRRPAIALPPRVSLLSSKPSVINIEVPLLTSYVSGTSRVIASVELGRRDSWKSLGRGEGREISVLSASLRGVLMHHGIRGLVTRFPLIFAFASAVVFLVVSLLFLGACILPTVLRPRPEGTTPDTPLAMVAPPPPTDAYDSSSDEDEKPLRRKRRARVTQRASRTSSRRNSIKTEAPVTTISSGGSESTPLRRRRSRLSETLSDSEA